MVCEVERLGTDCHVRDEFWWKNSDDFHTCSDVLLEKRCEDEEGKERDERESFRTVLCVRLSGQTKPSPSNQKSLSDSVTESVSLSL